MHSDDDDDARDFDDEEALESLIEGSKEATRKLRNARAYEIRRHLEDLQEKRRFQELFEDFD